MTNIENIYTNFFLEKTKCFSQKLWLLCTQKWSTKWHMCTSIFYVACYKCNIFVWNWSSGMQLGYLLNHFHWWRTRALAATVLGIHSCVSSYLWVRNKKTKISIRIIQSFRIIINSPSLSSTQTYQNHGEITVLLMFLFPRQPQRAGQVLEVWQHPGVSLLGRSLSQSWHWGHVGGPPGTCTTSENRHGWVITAPVFRAKLKKLPVLLRILRNSNINL